MKNNQPLVASLTFGVVMVLSGCASARRSPHTRHFAEVPINVKTIVVVAGGEREIRLVLFLKTSKFILGKPGFHWFPDTDNVQGAYCLHDGSVLAFEFSMKGAVIEICGKSYDLKRGRVFLAESKTNIDQLSVNLNTLPPPGVAYRLAEEAERLARENVAVAAFVEMPLGNQPH